MDDHELSAII